MSYRTTPGGPLKEPSEHYVGDACDGGHRNERADHRHVCIVCGVRWECKDKRRQCLGPIRNTCPTCKSMYGAINLSKEEPR